MTKRLSHKDKILMSLRRQGSTGACTAELYNEWRIWRIAARIYDLHADGFRIESEVCQACSGSDRHARYTLVLHDEPTLF